MIELLGRRGPTRISCTVCGRSTEVDAVNWWNAIVKAERACWRFGFQMEFCPRCADELDEAGDPAPTHRFGEGI